MPIVVLRDFTMRSIVSLAKAARHQPAVNFKLGCLTSFGNSEITT